MSKALQEVMQYANEDVASIHKHWIIFVKTFFKVIAFAIAMGFIKEFSILGWLAETIDSIFTSLPFLLSENITFFMVFIIFVYAVIEFIRTYIIYKTVGLTINNIQIKGKSGLANVGQVNASLEWVEYVHVKNPLFGRIFNYGNIEIGLKSNPFILHDMVDVDKFQEAIILMQEAQKEGRTLRSDERQDESRMNAAIMQTQAMGMLNQTISQALPGVNHNQSIEQNRQQSIEDNNYQQ